MIMEELNIEEKARRYDEAKYIMKEYLESGNAGVIAENTIRKAFPEFAESEDEKIKEELKKVLDECLNVRPQIVEETQYIRLINWLEKQQKYVGKIQLGKKYKCIASPRYSTFMIGKIYKPEDKFLCSLMNFCSDCFEPIEGEQKPADTYCQEHCKGYQETGRCFTDVECKAKIEAEQKSAVWSEEDDYNLQCCIAKVQNDIDNGRIGRNRELLTWLKSLRTRSQWKPSEGQLDCLEYTINL